MMMRRDPEAAGNHGTTMTCEGSAGDLGTVPQSARPIEALNIR
jgi:hypothetical protein